MKIFTVWATRPNSLDEPELVCAWDEYSADNNSDGFERDWKSALEAMGDDLHAHRHITLEIPASAVSKAFEVPVIELVLRDDDEF